MGRRPARRARALVGLAIVAGMTACSSESDGPPTQLVDGTRAQPPAVQLDAPTPQVLTRVVAVGAADAIPRTAAGECLRSRREHDVRGPVVVRTGVSGLSVTFRTASGRALVACDGSHAIRKGDTSWCGRAYGRLERGRLLDPRLDLAGCTAPSGDAIAFAWHTPGSRASYVAVRQDGYTEVYPVAGRVPVRVTAAAIAPDRSGATFEISEHDAGGALLRSSTLEARVAG